MEKFEIPQSLLDGNSYFFMGHAVTGVALQAPVRRRAIRSSFVQGIKPCPTEQQPIPRKLGLAGRCHPGAVLRPTACAKLRGIRCLFPNNQLPKKRPPSQNKIPIPRLAGVAEGRGWAALAQTKNIPQTQLHQLAHPVLPRSCGSVPPAGHILIVPIARILLIT